MLSRQATETSPIVFQSPPDVHQLVQAVNANASRVQQLRCDNVRLSVPGRVGSVRAKLVFDRPSRFRLSGESLRGPELDLGSNETTYWLWVRQNQPPTVFYGRQQEFHAGAAHRFLPLPPNQIFAEALGLVYLDPQAQHRVYESNASPGMLQVWSEQNTVQGPMRRIIEVDPQRAFIVKQLVYGPDDELVAVVDAADHTHDPLQNVSLPGRLKISLPAAGLVFQLQLDGYTVNQPSLTSADFEMPDIPGHRYLDLASPEDMRGIQWMGETASRSPDFYENDRMAESRAPRAAWLRGLPLRPFWR